VRRPLGFRHRIGLLVVLAAAGLVTVTAVALILGRRSEQQLSGIETRYVPLIELDRDLKMTFAQIPRALQDAAAAADESRLADADQLRAQLLARLTAGRQAILDNGGDPRRLEAEFGRYYERARAVSAALEAGSPAAPMTAQIEAMRDAQAAFAAELDLATTPDRRRLTSAFRRARESQATAITIDIAVAIAVLALMALLSWRLIRRTVRSLHEVSLGVERLARGDFDREIAVPGGDEISALADQANRTALRLREYREQSERDDWIKNGLAELGVAIAGELEPVGLARKAMTYLATYLGGDAAVAYLGDAIGEFHLLETVGVARAAIATPPFRAGDGVLGQAARDHEVRVVTGDRVAGLDAPHVAIVPLGYEGRAMGVLALALAARQPPPERAIELLRRARTALGIALRVAEAHRQAQTLLAAAAASNRELEAFSYSVSHDLRSPLRAIDGFSQALLERYQAQGADYLRRVRAAAQRMGELIDAMLQLSQVNRKPLTRQRIDLSEIARTLVDEVARRAPERAVAFEISDGLVVDADGRMMQALLDNLIGNAWKFTARTAAARIEIGAVPGDGPAVYFVRDNGAGFDMAHATKLFAPFQRLHSEAEFTGTGIGLATVRRIVDRHGGRVWAEGAVGRGATIYFTLSPATAGGPP
jgi:signal transduction histidine kinase/HAMP domain-containing protein